MNEALLVLLIGIGIATRQTEVCKAEARGIDQERLRFIGSPALRPAGPVPILWPPLKKMENK
jgi:hypothetical protein